METKTGHDLASGVHVTTRQSQLELCSLCSMAQQTVVVKVLSPTAMSSAGLEPTTKSLHVARCNSSSLVTVDLSQRMQIFLRSTDDLEMAKPIQQLLSSSYTKRAKHPHLRHSCYIWCIFKTMRTTILCLSVSQSALQSS